MRSLPLALGVLALAGCAQMKQAMPEAKIEVGAFGVTVGIDTRKVTDPVIDTAKSAAGTVTDAVGLTTPVPAVPAK